jgi:hypothetical protein
MNFQPLCWHVVFIIEESCHGKQGFSITTVCAWNIMYSDKLSLLRFSLSMLGMTPVTDKTAGIMLILPSYH